MSTDFETLEYEALESLAADLEQCLAEAEAQNKALREALAKAEEFGAKFPFHADDHLSEFTRWALMDVYESARAALAGTPAATPTCPTCDGSGFVPMQEYDDEGNQYSVGCPDPFHAGSGEAQ